MPPAKMITQHLHTWARPKGWKGSTFPAYPKTTNTRLLLCFTALFPVLNMLPGALGVTILGHHAFITHTLRIGKHIKDKEPD